MKNYPKLPELSEKINKYIQYAALKHEYGAEGIEIGAKNLETAIDSALGSLVGLPNCETLSAKEPDAYEKIIELRTDGPRRLWKSFDKEKYADRLAGAFVSRAAGCTLGAPVEFWSVDEMENWARHIGDAFPPVAYWSGVPHPYRLRYGKSECRAYTRSGMDGVPVDDDLAYTLLGLLIMEDYGPGLTTGDVGAAWLKYLPYACTAEDVALKNLRVGVDARDAADIDNPYCQWIGADIRSDPWAYMAPGLPEEAARLAYLDAYVSHRRNGIYGAMFFSAAQAAAFELDDPIEAVKIGMTEIPRECALYEDIAWALGEISSVKDYRQARRAVDDKFEGMSGVHTNLNACLTVFGLGIGGRDVTKVLSETVAMGQDNDCTAATAGSIVGAAVGIKNVPPAWHEKFNNKIASYLNGSDWFAIDDLFVRFARQAKRVFESLK